MFKNIWRTEKQIEEYIISIVPEKLETNTVRGEWGGYIYVYSGNPITNYIKLLLDKNSNQRADIAKLEREREHYKTKYNDLINAINTNLPIKGLNT